MKLRLLSWSKLLQTGSVDHGLLLPILFHCVDDAGQPMIGPLRACAQTPAFAKPGGATSRRPSSPCANIGSQSDLRQKRVGADRIENLAGVLPPHRLHLILVVLEASFDVERRLHVIEQLRPPRIEDAHQVRTHLPSFGSDRTASFTLMMSGGMLGSRISRWGGL